MSWYLLRAATRQEPRALQSLKELGLDAYCPMRTIWDRVSREKDARRKVALFPGYIFAMIPDERGLYGVCEADGVHAFVMRASASGERLAATVTASLVDSIVMAEALGLFDDTYTPPQAPWNPAKGDRVVAIGELMNGKVGEIVKVKGAKRIRVLFRAMGAAFNLDRSDVEPLPDDAEVASVRAA